VAGIAGKTLHKAFETLLPALKAEDGDPA
jgi:hypothetical protein